MTAPGGIAEPPLRTAARGTGHDQWIVFGYAGTADTIGSRPPTISGYRSSPGPHCSATTTAVSTWTNSKLASFLGSTMAWSALRTFDRPATMP